MSKEIQDTWLRDVIIVNESKDERAAGDVSIFRTEYDACRTLEPTDVTNKEYLAFNGVGERVSFGVDRLHVVIQRREQEPSGIEIVHRWLTETVTHAHEVRKEKANRGKLKLGREESHGVLPNTIEGFIAYLGFRER
jgi:hypothetical protein